MEFILTGDIYYEEISIRYGDSIIYDGYVDNLVTSEDGELELQLNYGDKSDKNNVIARRIGDNIFWIPNIKYCFKKQYIYLPILFSEDEFKRLWESMRYNPEDDLGQIKEITNTELLLTWFITSNIRNNVDNIYEYMNILKDKIIYIDIENEDVNKVILGLFRFNEEFNKNKLDVMNKQSHNMIKGKIYLDDNSEWDAIRISDKNVIYLRINNQIYIPIN